MTWILFLAGLVSAVCNFSSTDGKVSCDSGHFLEIGNYDVRISTKNCTTAIETDVDGKFICGTDPAGGSGDIEGVNTASPLTGGCASGTCSLDIDRSSFTLLGPRIDPGEINDGLGADQIDEIVIQQRITGNCNGQVMVSANQDGTVNCEADDTAAGGVPAGLIAFFAGACPSTWTEYTALQGKYVVGLPSGGTLEVGAGTALTNQEDRAVGQHLHTATDAGHTHNQQRHATTTGGLSGITTAPDTSSSAPGALGPLTASGTASITVANSGSVAGTNAPYVQLRACRKD